MRASGMLRLMIFAVRMLNATICPIVFFPPGERRSGQTALRQP
jgi:hypothetical protein